MQFTNYKAKLQVETDDQEFVSDYTIFLIIQNNNA